MKPFVEHVFRVYDLNGDGAFLEVGTDGDGLDMVEIRTTDKTSKEWFGEHRLSIDKDTARALGETLIKAANELEK